MRLEPCVVAIMSFRDAYDDTPYMRLAFALQGDAGNDDEAMELVRNLRAALPASHRLFVFRAQEVIE
jgi:hypothetical protein